MLHKLPTSVSLSQMDALVPSTHTHVAHTYILAPVEINIRLVLNSKGESGGVPKVDAKMAVDRLEIALTEDQFEDLTLLGDSMARQSRLAVHMHLR